MIKERDQQTVAVIMDAFRHLFPGNQRIGFVSQGKNQIGLLSSGSLVGAYHGDSVKQVSGVDHRSGEGSGQKAGSSCQQIDGHILHGPGINKQAHGHRPKTAIAALVHDNAKSKAQKYIAGHDRDCTQKSSTGGAFFMNIISLFGNT